MNAVILDVDGTLVDNNEAHIEAWRRAFAESGFDISRQRIRRELGKGGDVLVPSIVGDNATEGLYSHIRQAHSRAYGEIAHHSRFRIFQGVPQLLRELRRLRAVRAVATSSRARELEATLASAGLELHPWFEHIITAEDIPATKPAPDLITAAIARLGATPFRTVMVGDTRYDGIAALRAGAGFVGLTCGGNTAESLLAVGARWVFPDPEELAMHLPAVLDVRPTPYAPETSAPA